MSRDVLRAILKGDFDKLAFLVKDGADLKEYSQSEGWSYLHKALLMEKRPPPTEMVEYLLEEGVDINAVDVYGNTALYYAVRVNDPNLLKIMLSYGAEVNYVNKDGVSPLRQSVLMKPVNHECIRLLINQGADFNQRNEGGASIKELVHIVANGDDQLMTLFDA